MGKITIELFDEKAPITAKNFLRYMDEKHFDGTIFHRVIADFMIQGGGFEPGMNEKRDKHDPIKNEAVGGAVVRNHVRRRLRHLMRVRLEQLPDRTDIVVRALPAAAARRALPWRQPQTGREPRRRTRIHVS